MGGRGSPVALTKDTLDSVANSFVGAHTKKDYWYLNKDNSQGKVVPMDSFSRQNTSALTWVREKAFILMTSTAQN